MVKLSYIIPVYNVEQYIKRCLDSIYAQDIQDDDFEIICVDDCSTDKSREIILEYKDIHSNLKLIEHKSNIKAGGARNTGLLYACGEYIWFIDADDTICINAASTILRNVEINNLDVLCFNYQLIFSNKSVKEIVFEKTTKPVEGDKFLLDNFSEGIVHHLGYAVRAVYRKDVLIKNEVLFPCNVVYGEDTTFMAEACVCAKRVMAIDNILYNYVQHDTSSSAQLHIEMKGERIYESIFVAGQLVCKLKERVKTTSIKLANLIEKDIPWFVNRLFIRLVKTNHKERIKFYETFNKNKFTFVYELYLLQCMDKKNIFILKYQLLGRILLDFASILYRIKHFQK